VPGLSDSLIEWQQPAGLLDDFSSGLVMTQPIGLGHPNPISHVSAIFGHRVKEIVDHSGFGAILANHQSKAVFMSIALVSIWPQPSGPSDSKKRPDPRGSPFISIQHNAGVAMPIEGREFIHHQAPWLRLRQSASTMSANDGVLANRPLPYVCRSHDNQHA
jgi:hypothetical protein